MGILYIVATPIGNLDDITIRAIKTLFSVPIIACEDTRKTGQLVKLMKERFSALSSNTQSSMTKKYISVRDWNEASMVEKVIEELTIGDVALVSDAGTPLLSDPGFKIVREARNRGFSVIPIPGAFAGAAAISVSGLPTNKIMFWGFLPKKWELAPEITHVIYESPVRVKKTVEKIRELYPEAKIVIANELTKVHEKVAPVEEFDLNMIKGEVTILVYLGK